MTDLSGFDPNGVSNPNNNIFGLPFSEEDAELIILPVPWEVTVSSGAGTARSADHIFKASFQIDLYDSDYPDGWRKGFYMRPIDKKILLKSDYLRKEAELYIDCFSKKQDVTENKFMCKSLKEINEGGDMLNKWVYDQTSALLQSGKKVALLGGDHSTPIGFWKAIAEKHGDFGILQLDAHADLRISYGNFKYSHASIAYNGLNEIPEIKQLVQVGVRDYCLSEWEFIKTSDRISCFLDEDMKERLYEGSTWKSICDEIIRELPQKVYISFDIDALKPYLCPNAGTPVPGGLDTDQVHYLFRQLIRSGKTLVGFDLVEVGVGDELDWDAHVGARQLWKLCNLLANA